MAEQIAVVDEEVQARGGAEWSGGLFAQRARRIFNRCLSRADTLADVSRAQIA